MTNAINHLLAIEQAKAAGKKSYRFEPSKIEDFIPDYLGKRKKEIKVTDPLQRAEYQAFKAKLAGKQ